MGGRQSSPASDGRTRAYSGSDIPSSTGRGPIRGPAGVAASTSSPLARYPYMHGGHAAAAAGGSEHTPPALGSRSRSVGGIRSQAQLSQAGLSIPGAARDSGSSTPEEGGRERAPGGGGSRLLIGSLPSHLSPHLFGGFKCPVCSKFIPTDEMDLHLVMCLTKPRITYNEDVLGKDAGECTICLEDLQQGDTIARLPCLCIYHKGCIDEWFEEDPTYRHTGAFLLFRSSIKAGSESQIALTRNPLPVNHLLSLCYQRRIVSDNRKMDIKLGGH